MAYSSVYSSHARAGSVLIGHIPFHVGLLCSIYNISILLAAVHVPLPYSGEVLLKIRSSLAASPPVPSLLIGDFNNEINSIRRISLHKTEQRPCPGYNGGRSLIFGASVIRSPDRSPAIPPPAISRIDLALGVALLKELQENSHLSTASSSRARTWDEGGDERFYIRDIRTCNTTCP